MVPLPPPKRQSPSTMSNNREFNYSVLSELKIEGTPAKHNYCVTYFHTNDIYEDADVKDVQGRLNRRFRETIEHFKMSKINIEGDTEPEMYEEDEICQGIGSDPIPFKLGDDSIEPKYQTDRDENIDNNNTDTNIAQTSLFTGFNNRIIC